ncbi:cache domain-containing protein [Pontibacter anaerobius]|uniref:Cache domain-containing protein n=1 Tax=Pontibacter anaerobius TaxID=2993940 RepID=A0ABT3RHI0_9BACT|nr:cache domain-containing protein [Pontibacter anaerobius]MCX2740901.1 cache domain-containing protein [Pontibacter anaerobius]
MKITPFFKLLPFAILLVYSTQSWGSNSPVWPVAMAEEVRGSAVQDSTRQLTALVKDAAEMVRTKGEAAFDDFRKPGSRWRKGESYVFVLDPEGNMLVHPDTSMVGKNQLELEDVNGKPIIRGLISSATATPNKPEGWYHYEWPVPGGLLPRWKSSYVQLVKTPSGKQYIVGSGMYNDRMERAFVEDMVNKAAAEVEQRGEAAYKLFHDPAGPYLAKDTYIFVFTPEGVEIVNPMFPSIEGENNYDMKDTQGKYFVREILKTAQTKGAGWVDYLWPKPGESIPTQKSAYVKAANLDGKQVVVGAGVYLADAPKASATTKKMSASELMSFVNDAAAELKKRGEKAYPDFRKKGAKWLQDDKYLFVWTLDGDRVFHAANPSIEGQKVDGTKDAFGRPYGKMFLETVKSPKGEGWVHYMYPEPGSIFPTWKSSYVKRVTFPSGKQYLVGSGLYNMQMDKAFIEDEVNRAAALVQEQGKEAFDKLRDKHGPFYFLDTYVFVEDSSGVELVNPAQPSLEGKNLINEKDVKGKPFVREYTAAALKNGSAWVDYYWYRPGENIPTQKHTYVKKVQHGDEVYIVGSGFYPEDGAEGVEGAKRTTNEIGTNKE